MVKTHTDNTKGAFIKRPLNNCRIQHENQENDSNNTSDTDMITKKIIYAVMFKY